MTNTLHRLQHQHQQSTKTHHSLLSQVQSQRKTLSLRRKQLQSIQTRNQHLRDYLQQLKGMLVKEQLVEKCMRHQQDYIPKSTDIQKHTLTVRRVQQSDHQDIIKKKDQSQTGNVLDRLEKLLNK